MFYPNKYKLNLWKKSYFYIKSGKKWRWEILNLSIALLSHDIEAASVDNSGYVATSSRNKMADNVWNVKLLHLSCRWFIFRSLDGLLMDVSS